VTTYNVDENLEATRRMTGGRKEIDKWGAA
jgi:hypothetical protein